MARRNLEAKKFVVSFRVDRKEMQTLERLVEQSGLSLSNLVRERLNLGRGCRKRISHMRP